jgi:hypothetical protein
MDDACVASYVRSKSSLIEYMSRVSYFSVVHSLMYVMVCSRSDLSYIMSLVGRYMANSDKEY